MPLLILLFILALPIIELSVLIDIGGEIGALPTVALCLLTAAAGLSMVRHQGIKVFQEMQQAANRGEPVGASLVHGFFLAVAGVFLFIPGFMTDFAGALLLVPPIRMALGKAGMAHMFVRRGQPSRERQTVIIEGEYWEEAQTDTDDPETRTINQDQNTPKN